MEKEMGCDAYFLSNAVPGRCVEAGRSASPRGVEYDACRFDATSYEQGGASARQLA